MVNKRFWLGTLAMVLLVFGMTVVGCDSEPTDGNGGTGNNQAKKITITGITGKTGNYAMIWIDDGTTDDNGYIIGGATGMGSISGNSVTFDLEDDDGKSWTGNGSYYIGLSISGEEYAWQYSYTNGQTLAQLNITESDLYLWEEIIANLPKYNISSTISTIPFNKFLKMHIK